MDPITLFLMVLGFALIIGNVLISFLEQENNSKSNNLISKKEVNENETQIIESTKPIQETINYNKLMKNSIISLEQKINSMNNFKANTEIELKAMKEILLELQNSGKTVKAKKFKKKTKKLSKKELKEIEAMKKIAFNSSFSLKKKN